MPVLLTVACIAVVVFCPSRYLVLQSSHSPCLLESARAADPEQSEIEDHVQDWFSQYDEIRRKAKMTLREKLQTKKLLMMASNPILQSFEDSHSLIDRMSNRYAEAIKAMEHLPDLNQTEKLRTGYVKYFTDARKLFLDAGKIPGDDSRRQYLNALLDRKRSLEILDHDNKELDANLRKEFSVPAFRS